MIWIPFEGAFFVVPQHIRSWEQARRRRNKILSGSSPEAHPIAAILGVQQTPCSAQYLLQSSFWSTRQEHVFLMDLMERRVSWGQRRGVETDDKTPVSQLFRWLWGFFISQIHDCNIRTLEESGITRTIRNYFYSVQWDATRQFGQTEASNVMKIPGIWRRLIKRKRKCVI